MKCFATGRRSQTHSSVQALGAETANGCLVLEAGTTAEGHQRELKTLKTVRYALLPSGSGEFLASDTDLSRISIA
jgi:hypothetical protein